MYLLLLVLRQNKQFMRHEQQVTRTCWSYKQLAPRVLSLITLPSLSSPLPCTLHRDCCCRSIPFSSDLFLSVPSAPSCCSCYTKLADLSTSQPASLIIIDSGKQTTMISVHEDTSQRMIWSPIDSTIDHNQAGWLACWQVCELLTCSDYSAALMTN
jgi:hypothetical protein